MSEKITMKVAVYEYLPTGGLSALVGMRTVSSNNRDRDTDLIRISEFKNVEFDGLSKDQTLPLVIKALDDKIEAIRQDAIERVSDLQQQKSELLALNHDQ